LYDSAVVSSTAYAYWGGVGVMHLSVPMMDPYPIISIEDGHAESDWVGFKKMIAQLGSRIQIVGGDSLVTNPRIIAATLAKRHAMKR
jgi:enolase